MLAIVISVPLAMLAASRKDGIRDHVVRAVPLFGLGMPPFWVGLLLQYALALSLHIFPVTGYGIGRRRPPALDVPAQPDGGHRALRRWSSAACGPAC